MESLGAEQAKLPLLRCLTPPDVRLMRRSGVVRRLAGDLDREDTPEGVRVSVRLLASIAARYAPFALTNGVPSSD